MARTTRRTTRRTPAGRPPRPLAAPLVVLRVLGGVVVVVVLVVVAASALRSGSGGPAPAPAGERAEQLLRRATDSPHCSRTQAHRTGTWAMVRRADGTVEAVSFARGWEVYQGRRPGDLLAVCTGSRALQSP